MKKFNCPSCGAEVIFQSNVSVYAVCGHCSSMIVRRDVDVESIGKMAALPEDMSPLMLGTEGYYQDTRFLLVGRMKIGWTQGVWNEWYLALENGAYGWLAEAQGFYAVCFEHTEALHPDTAKAIGKLTHNPPKGLENTHSLELESHSARAALGTYWFINQLKYKVVDIKNAVCIGSEGELPFISPRGRKVISIDLVGYHGEFGNVEISQDKIRIYLGHYLDWNQLRCGRTRELESW